MRESQPRVVIVLAIIYTGSSGFIFCARARVVTGIAWTELVYREETVSMTIEVVKGHVTGEI